MGRSDRRPWQLTEDLRADGTLRLVFSGLWTLENACEVPATLKARVSRDPAVRALHLCASDLRDWDSALPAQILALTGAARARALPVDPGGLPDGAVRLLRAATAVAPHEPAPAHPRPAILVRTGQGVLAWAREAVRRLGFVGEIMLALGGALRLRPLFRARDLLRHLQQSGPDALPIVTLISFLVGLIMAFVGSLQLQQFGAQIYVANLVGMAIVREMAPMMVAVVMAGRTGAAYAAELGAMNAEEEIDALRTAAIAPTEFLVLPRVLALSLTMPLLTVYADALGILGGLAVGVGMLDLGAREYLSQTQEALGPADLGVGLLKSLVFGFLVAVVGCMRGMRAGRSSAGVGRAATSAVVSCILLIVIVDGVFAVLLDVLEL